MIHSTMCTYIAGFINRRLDSRNGVPALPQTEPSRTASLHSHRQTPQGSGAPPAASRSRFNTVPSQCRCSWPGARTDTRRDARSVAEGLRRCNCAGVGRRGGGAPRMPMKNRTASSAMVAPNMASVPSSTDVYALATHVACVPEGGHAGCHSSRLSAMPRPREGGRLSGAEAGGLFAVCSRQCRLCPRRISTSARP